MRKPLILHDFKNFVNHLESLFTRAKLAFPKAAAILGAGLVEGRVMSEASEEAFRAAREEIARVKAAGEDSLNLGLNGRLKHKARHLWAVPDEIVDLTQVTTLDLQGTKISDLTPIARMTGMFALNLSGTMVKDLTPIAKMAGMTSLDLGGNLVVDLTPIANLTQMRKLNISGCQVSDLTPIAEMTWINELYLMATPVKDLTPIAKITGMKTLSLWGVQVSDLTPISDMIGITTLFLSDSGVSDLNPIAGMAGMTRLFLSESLVSDLTPIAHMTGIKTLDLSMSIVRDLSPIARLTLLAEQPGPGGVSFIGTPAARENPRLGEIARIGDDKERGRALLDYLAEDTQRRLKAALQQALDGPILSDALADLEPAQGRFRATALDRNAEVPIDLRHDEILGTLQFASARFGRTETQNRIGRDVAANFSDYAETARQQPINPRILNFLANGIRAALVDEDLSAALDGFDKAGLAGFLNEHDALIREYYPRALIGPKPEVKTEIGKLQRELPPLLGSALTVMRAAEQDGLLAPSVSNALEMAHRQADGARRKLVVSGDPEERNAAERQLREDAVLATGFVGRVTARLKQFVAKEVERAQDDPVDATLKATGAYELAVKLIEKLTPVFHKMWELISNLPLPF